MNAFANNDKDDSDDDPIFGKKKGKKSGAKGK